MEDNQKYENPRVAKILDFKQQDWWGKSYEAFISEVEEMITEGWTLHSAEPGDKSTRFVLYPPEPEEEAEEA